MKEKLTQEELLFIEECIDFHKATGAKSLKSGILISILVSLFGYAIMGSSLLNMLLMMLGLILFTVYIWYTVFERPKSKLKQDLDKGVKVIQVATVNKIKNSKEGKIYLMNNGLEIKESDFEDDKAVEGNIEKGGELILAYTPCHKIILNIKRKNTAPNQEAV